MLCKLIPTRHDKATVQADRSAGTSEHSETNRISSPSRTLPCRLPVSDSLRSASCWSSPRSTLWASPVSSPFLSGMHCTPRAQADHLVTGTYLGDYFGILMSARVTGFPFNLFSDPMYVGSTFAFLGGAIL